VKIRWTLIAVFAANAQAFGRADASTAAAVDPVLQVAALDRRLADVDNDERADRAELVRTSATIAGARARVATHGKTFYKLMRAGLLPVGGGFDALVRHAMFVERAKRRVLRDLADQRGAQTHAEDIARDLERLARDRVDLSAQRDAAATARAQMEDETRRQQAFDKAFESSGAPASEYVAVYGSGGMIPEGPAGGFASAKGRLLFPVVGRSEVRPARRDGTSGPGMEIHADAGSAVRAVFAARVAFADRYGPYGRIVILDHGDHYYTVSGNLDVIDVKVGQELEAGDRIGTVGDDGQGPMLYFEVRRGSQTIAPGPWLGL
jgi:murein DD-endopeptidase MepM/ murein hydrolase activator NlpD